MKTRQEEMRQQVSAFHREHPDVWELFVSFTNQMIDKGYQHYSVNAIFERIRWEKDVGGDGVNSFKLNNNYRAFYARRFMKMYPKHEGFFRTREQTSLRNAASGLLVLGPADYEENYNRV